MGIGVIAQIRKMWICVTFSYWRLARQSWYTTYSGVALFSEYISQKAWILIDSSKWLTDDKSILPSGRQILSNKKSMSKIRYILSLAETMPKGNNASSASLVQVGLANSGSYSSVRLSFCVSMFLHVSPTPLINSILEISAELKKRPFSRAESHKYM